MRINTSSPEETTEVIHNVLFSQAFATWYNTGAFDTYITGEGTVLNPTPTKEEIIKQIKHIFKINS